MTLSVIIPVYNGETFLKEAVSSVLSQPCLDLELLLVNDGSTDSTPYICEELAQLDPRVRYIAKENGGVSEARNTGLTAASGTYVVFLDADDWWFANTYTDELRAQIETEDADIFLFGMAWTDQTYKIVSTYTPEYATSYTGIPKLNFAFPHLGCFFYRRTMLLDTGTLFLKDFFYGEDTIFQWQALCRATELVTIQVPLYIYRDNVISVVHTTKELVAFRQSFLSLQKIMDFFQNEVNINPLHPDTFSAGAANFYLSNIDRACCILNYRTWKKTFINTIHTEHILAAIKKGIYQPRPQQRTRHLHIAKQAPFYYYWTTKIKKRIRILLSSFYSKLKKKKMDRRKQRPATH